MSNPFADLQTALSNVTGLDFTLSGLVLGLILTIAILIMLELLLNSKGGKGDSIVMWSGGLGIAISYAVGWFPLYIPIFVGIIVVFLIVGPLSSKSSSGG